MIGSRAFAADPDPRWLRIYQYERSGSHFRSAIAAERFFFSPSGMRDPAAELQAAIEAFSNPDRTFGTQKQPAACVFPARLQILESILKREFPHPACNDLDDWIARIGADEVSLVFVGAYSGNPASILGHTFLRLGRSQRTRLGEDLLSYSVGFLAQTDGSDNRLTYMTKGLTGGYPGSYEIEPHYMKVGLYNNSESRDLWEVKLRFSPEEVRLLVKALWELTFNAQIPYYFIDENCSYRLLTLLEAVQPKIDLVSHLSTVVLPAETVRAVLDSGWGEPSLRFRASILRRLQYKFSKFTPEQKRAFHRDLSVSHIENAAVSREMDPKVADAALDDWIYRNYRAQAQLPPESAAIMEATYSRVAALPTFTQPTDSEIREAQQLQPPFEGHNPKWFSVSGGELNSRSLGSFEFRSGVHPFWSGDPAYREITAIEYLGVSAEASAENALRWQALLINAKSFENTFGLSHPIVWELDIHAGNDCEFCDSLTSLQFSGGAGASYRSRNTILYSLAHLETALTVGREGADGRIAPGVEIGIREGLEMWTLTATAARHWWKDFVHTEGEGRLNYTFGQNCSFFAKARSSDIEGGHSESRHETSLTLGWAEFFN